MKEKGGIQKEQVRKKRTNFGLFDKILHVTKYMLRMS